MCVLFCGQLVDVLLVVDASGRLEVYVLAGCTLPVRDAHVVAKLLWSCRRLLCSRSRLVSAVLSFAVTIQEHSRAGRQTYRA